MRDGVAENGVTRNGCRHDLLKPGTQVASVSNREIAGMQAGVDPIPGACHATPIRVRRCRRNCSADPHCHIVACLRHSVVWTDAPAAARRDPGLVASFLAAGCTAPAARCKTFACAVAPARFVAPPRAATPPCACSGETTLRRGTRAESPRAKPNTTDRGVIPVMRRCRSSSPPCVAATRA